MKFLAALILIYTSLSSVIFTSEVALDGFDFSINDSKAFGVKSENEVSWRIGSRAYLATIKKEAKKLHIIEGAKFRVDSKEVEFAEEYPC